jgi:Uma2 family endonuclease
MATAGSQPPYYVDEYLAVERASEEQDEYTDGHVFAMASESGAHGDITVNLVGEVSTQLKAPLQSTDERHQGAQWAHAKISAYNGRASSHIPIWL